MKKFTRQILVFTALIVASLTTALSTVRAQPGGAVSFQLFYDELSPYGRWIDDPEYGYVWSPEVDQDFRPYYSNGRWMMTDYGNTWVSDYDWGWAPFHYGRWTFDNYYGWLWVPGEQWGPAWVDWRQGGGYYGWAPMGPGININLSFGNNYYAPNDWWTFIPCQHIYQPNYHSYWRGPRYNTTIFRQTTVINNYYNNRYVSGPGRRDVARHVGKVNVYQIRNVDRPGRPSIRNNGVAVYRPQIHQNDRNGNRSAPRQVVNAGNRQDLGNRRFADRPSQNSNPRVRPSAANAEPQRSFRNERQPDTRREQPVVQQSNPQEQRPGRWPQNNDQEQAVRANRNREEMRQRQEVAQRETAMQRENQQRARQENDRFQQVQQARQENIRQQEMRNRQQMMEQRRQMNRQNEPSQRPQRAQPSQAPQREWRRPEPQRQQQPVERRQIERSQPAQEQGSPRGRGR